MDLLIVGAGLFGLTVAEQAANSGHMVTVIDKRDHIGGNAYSYFDSETNIEVHKYGSHLFHTSNQRVWEYANRFTRFNNYQHRVFSRHANSVFSLPINLATINQFFNRDMNPEDAKKFIESKTIGLDPSLARNFEERGIALIGKELYDAFIKNYTQKQWQTEAKLLPAEIINRLPVRYNYDNRYFSDRWEGLPLDGYGKWFEKMIDHPNITVVLNNDFFDSKNRFSKKHINRDVMTVYTGPLDKYFDFCLGELSWRTLDFQTEILEVRDYQGTSVMNYADLNVPFTRIHEYKHLHPEREQIYSQNSTVISREFSRVATVNDEPYYPVDSQFDRQMISKYRDLMKAEGKRNVYFGGRLGTYRYLDMHMAIGAALTFWNKYVSNE